MHTYILITVDDQEFEGYSPQIRMGLWKPKRKSEPTLTLRQEGRSVNLPCSQVKSLILKDQ